MADKIKDLQTQIDKCEDPLEKLMLENRLAWEYGLSYPAKAIELASSNRQKALNLKNNNEVGFALMAMASAYLNMSDFDSAFKYAFEANEILTIVGNKRGEARSLNILGNTYFALGNYEECLKYRFKSLSLYEEIGNDDGKVLNLLNLGNVHGVIRDFDQALNYFFKAVELVKKRNDSSQLKSIYMNIGSVFAMQKNYDKALEYYALSSQLIDTSPSYSIVNLYNNLGEVYFLKGNYEESKHYYELALLVAARIPFKHGEAGSLLGLSKCEGVKNNYKKAIALVTSALMVFKELKINQGILEALLFLSELHEKQGDHATALTTFKEYDKLKEEIANSETEKKARNLLLLHQVEDLKKDSELQRTTNAELKKVNQEIERINKNLLASIDYAKHIQDSILPNENLLKQYFPDSFIFSKPKDIVSGDFFWIYEKEDEVLVATVDCTGHGVPGAFLSVVANSLLNQVAMNQWPANTAFMLNELNFLMERGLTRKDEGFAKDGMDIALCSFDKEKTVMTFSGAHSSVYVVSKGKLNKLKGDNISIGNTTAAYFNNIKVDLDKGDCVYLLTDGYADQRGGPDKKKFYYEPLEQLLLTMHIRTMHQQKEKIEQNLNAWMDGFDQIDDILVIGIRI